MLNIFVCEDNDIQRQAIVQIIQNTVLIEELDMQLVMETGNPYVLLDEIRSSQNTGVYFLDIDLNSDMNGMKLAQQIRLFDPRGFIIFITAHSELSFMTFQYRVEAMDFVLKDNPAGGRKISVDYDDIFFFETSSNIHKVILHAKDRQIEFVGTIKELANSLDDNFVRCHRSFLVNKSNIKEVNAKNRIIHFTNGETCLMSTRMMKQF